MNEQQLADLFSEQVDRLLNGEPVTVSSHNNELQELLDIVGKPTVNHQFQAGSAAQVAFQSQLAGWFGSINGGTPMTILGLSKTWFISIIIATVIIVGGGGLIAVIATSIFIAQPVGALPPTGQPTTEPTTQPTDQPTVEPSAEPTGQPTTEPTAEPTTQPPNDDDDDDGNNNNYPTLIFRSDLLVVQLCQGAYVSQRTLVNYGSQPVSNASLAWEVVEGPDLIDKVDIVSDALSQPFNQTSLAATSTSNANTTLNYANFNQISVEQEVKLNVKVKVKDEWWDKPDGTKIKVKLNVKNRVEFFNNDDDGDHNRGHGNDPDGFDEDNPGRGHSQTITIVKQGAQWVTLTGVAHSYGNQNLLVDGVIVATNNCTGLPPNFVPGSKVKVVGVLQPDGAFMAINIVVININLINGDFDSGVPVPGPDDDDGGSSSSGGGGGGGGGGSKGGSGGSRGGS